MSNIKHLIFLVLFVCPITLHAQATSGAATISLEQCPSGTVTKYAFVPVTAQVPVVMSQASSGDQNQANLRCQLLSTALPGWYAKVTSNGGTSFSWVAVTSLLPVTPPVISPPALPASAVLTWTAPTTDVNGNPLTVPLTYNVYRGAAATTLTLLTNVSAMTYTDPAGSSTPTTYFYAVTATCASCVESADSGVVSTTIAAPALQPSAPTLTVK
jgi:hypothetical protein